MGRPKLYEGCTIAYCPRPHQARGYCKMHYERLRKKGDAFYSTRGEPAHIRFFTKVRHADNGCWIWESTRINTGYGSFWVDGRHVLAHRWSYEFHIGPIPSGLVLDHFACETPACVNPTHVRPVTQHQNCLRSRATARTHCPSGHEYAGDNLIVNRHGHRFCRACKRASDRAAYRVQKRAQRV